KVPLAAGSQVVFGQPDSTAPRHYLLARLDAPITPAVSAHSAVNFGNVLEKDAIYIGPAQWNNALQPLLTLRTAQGHNPLFVDVQAIFDVYGYGYVSAPAIRNFLRHRTDWQNLSRTISVVLVGDGTYDPYNFRNTGFGSGLIHPIPPYMLDVDIYINEAPCETCFAQLNGDDPVTGDDPNARNPKSNVFVPDVWLGRFPVRNEAELTAMVNKIVAYEQGPDLAGWGSTQLLLADNYIVSINDQNQVTLDPGGDFAFYSDEVVALAGYGANVRRVYYDHSPDRKVLEKSGIVAGRFDTVERHPPEPWRFPSVNEARQKSVEAINAGAGLMFYNGHSNHWQYARLEDRSGVAVSPLFSTIEANALANGDKLFIGLSMTCLTSQFAIPAVSGTLDELFVRNPNGGAVATWGPTGLSVAHGHDYLQKGFVSKLRYSPVDSQRLGDLVEAGYDSLLTSPLTNSLDALKTFAVLGDPLTRVRVNVGFDNGIFLPTVQR
ncbi:MAG: C25 family cysteine peptidase, partial [Caldilinea sp.]